MGNNHTKLRQAGGRDVTINQGKRKGQAPQRIKRPKRFEINFLPSLPDGEFETSTESKPKKLAGFLSL